MNRRTRYIMNLVLLLVAVVAAASGLLVDQLDLNDFALHRWAGYAVALLMAIHVGLHWRFFLPQRPRDPAPPESRADVSTPAAEPSPQSVPLSRRSALAAAGAGVTGIAVGWWGRAAVSPNGFRTVFDPGILFPEPLSGKHLLRPEPVGFLGLDRAPFGGRVCL